MNSKLKLRLNVLPLLSRELRVTARLPQTYRERLLVGGSAMAFILVVIVGANLSGFAAGGGGGGPLMVLAYAALYYSCIAGLVITVDSLGREKREGTLGLLFLTGLSGGEIILGKWMVGALRVGYGLLAAGPALAVCFALGGVEGMTVVQVMTGLLVAVAFSTAIGVWIAAVAAGSERLGGIVTLIVPLFLMGMPAVSWWLRDQWNAPVVALMLDLFSPATPIRAVFHPPPNAPASLFIDAVLGNLATTLALLWLAGRTLARNWHIEVAVPANRLARAWRQIRFGSPARRAALRARLLAVNPLCWLNTRDRFSTAGPWIILVCTYGLLLLAWRVFTPKADLTPYWFAAALVADVCLRLAIASEAGMGIWRHRESGAIELILATPLNEREVIRGQWLALRRRFTGAVIVMTGINLALLGYVHFVRLWTTGALFVSFVLWFITVSLMDYLALGWVGIWCGASARKASAATGALGRVIWPQLSVVLTGVLVMLLAGVLQSDERRWFILLGWATLCIAVSDLLRIRSARRNLFQRFRQVVAETPHSAVIIAGDTAQTESVAKSHLSVSQAVIQWARKWRWALAAVVIVLSTFAGYRFWLKQRVDRALAKLAAAGQPVEFADLDRLYPYLPPEQNAAPAMRAALEFLTLPWMVQTNFSWNLNLRLRSAPFTPNMISALNTALNDNRSSLESLRTAMRLDQARFQIDWEGNSQWTFIRGLFSASSVFRYAAWAHLERGENDEAVTTVLDMYRLAHLLADTPHYLPHYARQAQIQSGVLTLERFLALGTVTDDHLRRLEAAVRQAMADADKADRLALASFQCGWLKEFSRPMSEIISRRRPPVKPAESLKVLTPLAFRRLAGRHHHELLAYLDAAEQARRILEKRFPERAEAAKNLEQKLSSAWPKNYEIARDGLNVVAKLLDRTAQTHAHLRLTATSIVLERFRLKHGRYPRELMELVPAFLPELPQDPFDGRPLRYTPLPTGFSLHSVGPDGKDDGGIRDEKNNWRKDILFTVEH